MPLSPPGHRDYVCGLKPAQPQPAEQPQPRFRRAPRPETQEEDQHRDKRPLRLREEFSSGEVPAPPPRAAPRAGDRMLPGLTSSLSAEPEAYLRGDPADRRAAAHGEGSNPCLVLQPAPEGETHQPLQRSPHAAQSGQAGQLQPPPGTKSPARGGGVSELWHTLTPWRAPPVKHNLPGCPQCSQNGWRQGEPPLGTGCHMGGAQSHRAHCFDRDTGTARTHWHGHTQNCPEVQPPRDSARWRSPLTQT